MKRLILIAVGIALVLNTPVAAQQASQNIPVLPVIPQYNEDGVEDPAWYLKGDGYLQRQVEPTIAVSTRNPDHVLSFFVDYRAVNVPDDVGLGEETQTFAMAMKTTNMMLAGLISLPEFPFLEAPPIAAAEAWVGGSASYDGGLTWSGFFMPGASFDDSLISQESPVYGLDAATDPVAVAGPCGYVYVIFMGFNRGGQSKIVVARFQDLNDSESGKTWQYQGTTLLETGNNALNGYFLDKGHINLDVFRDEADFSTYGSYFSDTECGHRVFTSYSTFNGLDKEGKFQSKINFAMSMDGGQTWDLSKIQQPYTQNQGSFIAVDPRPGTPTTTGGGSIYLVWRHFYSPDSIVMIKTTNYGKKWSKPIELIGDIPMQTFDQPTIQAIDGYALSPRELAFRSNAFPTAAVAPFTDEGDPDNPADDTEGAALYVAWQERVNRGPLAEGADPVAFLSDPDETYGRPDENGSPRIVMVKSLDGGESFSDIYDNPGARVAVDMDRRDDDSTKYPPPGFGALPTPRESGPQVKPWLSFGGGELALAYSESRGRYRPFTDENGIAPPFEWYHDQEDLSPNGFISDIDRVMDFRVVMLDPSTGVPKANGSTQVSRYPISFTATFGENDVETIDDVAPVDPELCDRFGGPPEYCQPRLNFVNKNHSGAGHAAFMGDYPGMTPILPMIYDNINDQWRWATDAIDVPYPAFHVVFPDSRHLIPPVDSQADEEWERYPNYEFYPNPPTNNCINAGSRNVDVLTAKVNAELVLSAPTTYKQGSPGDPTWGYPITVFNQSGRTRFFELTIVEGDTDATFVVDEDLLEDPDIDPISGVVEIFAYSSTSQMVYVYPPAGGQIIVEVNQVDCTVSDGEYVCDDIDGELGFVTLNPDPSNPETDGSEAQNVNILTEGVEEYTVASGDLTALNPFVRNPFVRNPFVRNPFVRNPFVRNDAISDDVEVIDTTWSVQATAESGAGSYLPVINIDNADEFLKNYAFQLLIYKNAFYGTFADCKTWNVPNAQIISNVSQSNTNSAENPFVRNPFVRNPFVRNPFVRNPFVRNSAITVAPADGVTADSQEGSQTSAKNLIFDEDGTLRVPRVPEKIFITLRAFKLNALGSEDLEYKPEVDKPAFSFVPTRCTTSDCIKSLAPDLVPTDIEVTTPDYADLPARTVPTDPNESPPEPVQVPLGETITFNFKVRNLGNVPADAENRDLRHAFYLSKNPTVDPGNDDQSTSSDKILLLGPGASPPDHVVSTIDPLPPGGESDPDNFEQFSNVTVEIPYDINPADFDYLILFMDDYREVSENNEINNQHAMLVELVKLNHAPTFTSVGDVQVLEDSVAYSAEWATELDNGDPGSDQEMWFEVDVTSNPPALFLEGQGPTLDANGVLSFTPAPDRYGTAVVSVVLVDNGDDGTENPGSVNQSAEVTFTIEVLPINDPPSFEPGIDNSFNVSVPEDAGLVSIVNWATNITAGPFEDDVQNVSFSTPTVDNPALFQVPPAISSEGVLSFTPASNMSGIASLSVYLWDDGGIDIDNGGVDRSDDVPFTITVTPVKDYDFLGFYAPWTEDPIYIANVGSAIPLKWQYAQNGTVVDTSLLYPRVMVRGPFDCGYEPVNPGDPEEPPPPPPDGTWSEYEPLNFPGSSDYRYSESSETWQFNWDTNDLAPGCYNTYVKNHAVNEIDGPFRIKLR